MRCYNCNFATEVKNIKHGSVIVETWIHCNNPDVYDCFKAIRVNRFTGKPQADEIIFDDRFGCVCFKDKIK